MLNIKVGDIVTNKSEFDNLNSYFDTPKKVVHVTKVEVPYAGNAFIQVEGSSQEFYASALKVVKIRCLFW